jgi:hypothetical protein
MALYPRRLSSSFHCSYIFLWGKYNVRVQFVCHSKDSETSQTDSVPLNCEITGQEGEAEGSSARCVPILIGTAYEMIFPSAENVDVKNNMNLIGLLDIEMYALIQPCISRFFQCFVYFWIEFKIYREFRNGGIGMQIRLDFPYRIILMHACN